MVTIRKLCTVFGHHSSPNKSTVCRLIKKFEERGPVQDIKSPGRPRSDRSEANSTIVRDSVTVCPGKSCRHRAQKIHISTATTKRILKNRTKCS